MKQYNHITMKQFILFLFLLFPLAGLCQVQQKPNIIIILADDLGWGDVGFHGSEIHTPNIDRLASEGIILDQFYTAPICSPTRAGLMTGRYPNRFGLRQTVIPPWSQFGVDTSETFLPQMLAGAGYKNRAAIGKWHLGHARKMYLPLHRGFTHFYGFYNGALDYFTHKREGELDWHNDSATCYDKGYTTDLITNEAVKCIKEYAKSSPFFLYVAYNAPHGPLQAKKEDLLAYGYDPNKPSFGKGDHKGRGNTKRQTYSAMVTCMDRGVGKILETLKNLDIDKNTVVLFFSDNGAAPHGGGSSGALRGNKFQEWNGGVRAPAIIRWPNGLKGPGKTEQVMGYVDVMPTLLTIAGAKIKPQKPLDGINMLPVIKEEEKNIDRYFYLGYGAMIHSPWKLVKAHSGNPRMKEKEDVLFDLLKDPSEKNNIKNEYQKIYMQLKKAVKPYDNIQPAHSVPPYGQGRKGFEAPENWVIKR